MEMLSIPAFIVYLFVAADGHGVNYCGAKMCGYTDAHTFCQFSTGPSLFCTGMIPALLSLEEKTRILERLNRRRHDVASGSLRGFPSAGNMLKLHWVEELAREAQLWANQCRPPRAPEEHDACRDLYAVSVGQCVASVVGEAPGLRVESLVDVWFMQNKHFKGNVTLYEPPEPNKYFYGDFAQIVWARTFMVGCGRSRFMLPMNGRLRTIERLVCNFAPKGPFPYRSVWNPGAPATACPARSRPFGAQTSLCDYQKEFDQQNIDTYMSIEDHTLLNALFDVERNETLYNGSLDEMYLTYLSIVTMANTVSTTAHYNSIQKRDIVEKTYAENSDYKGTPNAFEDYTKSQTECLATKLTEKKPKTIGRPKAYKLEELSNSRGNHNDENHEMTEAVPKRKKEFYYDYNTELVDENVTNRTERKTTEMEKYGNPKTKSTRASVSKITFEDHTYELLPIRMNATAVVFLEKPKTYTEGNVRADTMRVYTVFTAEATTESTVTKDAVEEYLSDPETVRQLQEALDRMEREASNSSRTTRKTRDVQEAEMSDEQNIVTNAANPVSEEAPNFTLLDSTDISSLQPPPSGNSSQQSPPVLGMMLKYMPYLKNYENDIIGRTTSSANCITPSALMIVTIFFNLLVYCTQML